MIKLSVDKESYLPGQTINASAAIVLSKPIHARGMSARLYCAQKKEVESLTYLTQEERGWMRQLGEHPHSEIKEVKHEVDSDVFVQEKLVCGSGTFKDQVVSFSFTLPANAPPTSYELGHDGKIHIWHLEVKLDVPFAFDKQADVEIKVSGLSV
ncbi:hypothetical protein FJZ26_00115 [Candidatus Parvarchaeota archaeon]|nr:hypothetical protein [Candidatus Parvarchaeota archaeon]